MTVGLALTTQTLNNEEQVSDWVSQHSVPLFMMGVAIAQSKGGNQAEPTRESAKYDRKKKSQNEVELDPYAVQLSMQKAADLGSCPNRGVKHLQNSNWFRNTSAKT